jgi:hypothetical protein
MDQPPYSMDRKCRDAVAASVLDHCSHRDWSVLASHVRSSHVHIVIESEARPVRIMNDLPLASVGHGSARWLSKAENVSAAVRYVVDEQGEPHVCL